MRKLLQLAALLFVCSFSAKAADLIVEENGLAPTYSSISAAVAAANPGDRIFIQNRAGNIPWFETVTINKSLTIVAYVNDSLFFVQGAWSISGGATQMTVNIIGMVNESGSLTSTADGPSAGSRDTVRVLGGAFYGGSITFNNNFYDLQVYGVKMSAGNITYRHGSIIGDSIVAVNGTSGISVVSETGTGIPTNDTSFILGNIIWTNDPSPACCSNEFVSVGISWTSNTMFFDIRNNLIYFSDCGIYVSTSRATNATINKIYNCTAIWNNNNSNYGCFYSSTCDGYGTYGWMGMYLATGGTGSIIEVMDNVVAKATTPTTPYVQYGIVGVPNGGAVNAYYNYIGTGWATGALGGSITVNSNNNISTALTGASFGTGLSVGNWTGNSVPTYPPAGTNLGFCSTLVHDGNPGNVYDNLDLTTNTVGAYGGSYSLLNYYPQNTGSTRTWMFYYPFNARIGTTISAKASSFDR